MPDPSAPDPAGPVAEAPAWLDELRPRPGPPWLSMGLHPLDPERWLVVDERYGDELAIKARLLRTHPDQVFQARPGTEAAGGEVLARVERWLGDHHPDGLRRRDHSAAHPLDRAARLVQEDLCLMVEREGRYHLEAASVCFPSHWRLAEKMGRPLAAIHAPVHHYATELESRVDTFFARLRPDRPVVRRNVSFHDHDDLFRPEPHESASSFPAEPESVDQVWLRSERQTLLRLPVSRAVLFTIKTEQCRASALTAHPELAHRLARRLGGLEAHARAHDQPVAFPPWFVSWLAAR